ncbi:MAG: pyrroloquinoline quinone-dependent dehydrogenase [Acidobacteria bacterium]|nr:pyrroloquinoline quinone-dependent dehydrogenase [Acidobacteriota bacterium]
MTRWSTLVAPALLLLLSCCSSGPTPSAAAHLSLPPAEWPAYANDGGTRWSPLTQIDRNNVGRLAVAWTYRTGENHFENDAEKKSTFEVTPIVVDGTMVLTTGFNKVIALDAASGKERWTYDPHVDRNADYSEVTSRGVATWVDWRAGASLRCRRRIFEGTIDARLLALDAATGQLCADFGTGGLVDLKSGIDHVRTGDYQMTSPPAVIGDLVIVGSSVGDNSAAELERGVVRAYDVRTGQLRWSWDPMPHEKSLQLPGAFSRPDDVHTGAANAWAPMTPDQKSGLLFVPTSSPSPDYYGGLRLGRNDYANSIVALHADSGKVAWHFQVVHHDLWDYDVATQPVLIEVQREGRSIPAVAVGTKMGHLFIFDRTTGAALFPIEERPVPASDVAGEEAWPTQPFPTAPKALVPQTLKPEDAFGADDADRGACRDQIAALRFEGMFTPPSVRGTMAVAGNIGGMHWGGMSYDPIRHLLVANTNRLAVMVRLIPREQYAGERSSKGERITGEYNRMSGTPFGMFRTVLLSPKGVPCSPPPWGGLTAIDVDHGSVKWDVPFGGIDQFPEPMRSLAGSPNLGGSMSSGGLVFIGAAMDQLFRAFDVETGRQLWSAPLPASAQASPMTYSAGGRQFVVIAAGGHGKLHTARGDYVVAFALPK